MQNERAGATKYFVITEGKIATTRKISELKMRIKTVFCNTLCEIRQCALKKGVETCGDCLDLKKCKLVGMIISNNPDTLKNLEMGD